MKREKCKKEDKMIGYDKVVFVCTGNTFCSPLAEAVYRSMAPTWLPSAISRGIVVLFSEPINPKVNALGCIV